MFWGVRMCARVGGYSLGIDRAVYLVMNRRLLLHAIKRPTLSNQDPLGGRGGGRLRCVVGCTPGTTGEEGNAVFFFKHTGYYYVYKAVYPQHERSPMQ